MIDWTKPIQTRDGRPAELLKIGRISSGATHLVFIKGENNDDAFWAHEDGVIYPELPKNEDIINVPVKHKRKVWINMYEDTEACASSFTYSSRKTADSHCGMGRIACIEREIEFTEGEGL